jgi:hypothetical protein
MSIDTSREPFTGFSISEQAAAVITKLFGVQASS